MASLRKKTYKSGKTVWVIDYYNGNKRLMKTIGNCDKRTAEQILTKFKGEQSKINAGIVELKKITLSTLQSEYLKYAESTKAKRSVEREKLVLNAFLQHFGDTNVSDISITDIQNYRNSRLRTINPVTANLEFRHLKAIFNWAKERDYLSQNLFIKIKPIRTPESELPKFFEVNEIKKVRKEFKDDPFQHIVEFYILTGARLKRDVLMR